MTKTRSPRVAASGAKWGAALLTLALVAAACGDDDADDSNESTSAAEAELSSSGPPSDLGAATTNEPDSQPTTSDASVPPATSAPGTDPGTTVEDERDGDIDPDATFVFGYNRQVTRLDPHQAGSGFDGTTLFPVYDRLVHLSSDGQLIPGLAESWEFSPDATELTLHLREGVSFHDGAPFDADAAKVNLDRARGMEGSSVATDLATIESVEVVDPMTVLLTLTQADVSLLGPLSDRAGIQVSPQAIAEGANLDEQMVGAGPYRFVSHDPGGVTVYERNDDYWDVEGIPKVAGLELRILTDDITRLNALRSGELSATQIGSGQVEEMQTNPGFQVVLSTELQFVQLIQNRARATQDDLRVRQALVHALDREAICDAVYFGFCEVSEQPFPPGYYAFNTDIDQVPYPYDPDRARELLAEAGVTDLQLGMLVGSGLTQLVQLAEVIQAQFAEVGVTLTISQVDASQVADLMFAQESSDTSLGGASGRPDPSQYLYGRMRGDSFGNPGGHSTPKMEELITQSIAETDPDARESVLQAASREVAESLLEINVVIPQIPYAMQSNVEFTPFLTAKPEFRNVAVYAD